MGMKDATGPARTSGKKTLDYSAKDRIDHAVFGLGTIVEIDERHTTIAFDTAGTRKFMTSMVQLVPSDTPAPARRTRPAKKAAPAR
jgi:hypothetical protein